MHEESEKLPKIIVILGPTASGKTELGIQLARQYNGEIISADSRQVYRDMDIGTAKPDGEWRREGLRRYLYIDGIKHHLMDFLNPGKRFAAAEFRDLAVKYAKMILKEGKVPVVVGGTGLYISTLIDNFSIPRVEANEKLRRSLEEKSLEQLFTLLQTMDEEAAKKIDRQNKRRLIRALEVCILTGEKFSQLKRKGDPLFDALQIGLLVERDVLSARIEKRVDTMVKRGLVKEIQILLKKKYSWSLPSMSGIGYREFRGYFEGTDSLDNAVERLKKDSRQYAKRQMTWFRRDHRIKWITDHSEATDLVEEFLGK